DGPIPGNPTAVRPAGLAGAAMKPLDLPASAGLSGARMQQLEWPGEGAAPAPLKPGAPARSHPRPLLAEQVMQAHATAAETPARQAMPARPEPAPAKAAPDS